jgi:hypothetical protein
MRVQYELPQAILNQMLADWSIIYPHILHQYIKTDKSG